MNSESNLNAFHLESVLLLIVVQEFEIASTLRAVMYCENFKPAMTILFVDGVPKSWTPQSRAHAHISGHMKFISMNAKRNNSRKVSAQGYVEVVYM